MDYRKIYKKIEKRYLIMGLVLVLLLILRQILVQYEINLGKDMSKAINISGRQRMLSQKITKDVLIIYENQDVYPAEAYLDDLALSLEAFKKAQHNLINCDKTGAIKTSNSDTIIGMFDKIDPYFNHIVASGTKILDAFKEKPYDDALVLDAIKIMISNEKLFLKNMDQIVSQYEIESELGILQIEKLEKVIFYLIIFFFAFASIFILIPTTKVLRNAFIDVNESNENMKKLFYTMKGALFVVNEAGTILLTNTDAKEMKTENDNIKESIKWLDINIMNLVKEVSAGQKIENREVQIESKDDKNLTFLISASNISYHREEAVLIGAYNITSQKKAEEILKTRALKDELTGLYNRYFFDFIMADEMKKSTRYDYPLSVGILDIDDFKKINDTWGHPVGDDVLKEIASLIIKHSRDSDYQVRIGGEEFVILMPHTNLDGAYTVAEKLRKVIEENTHPIVGKYTVSFGVAQRNPNETYLELYSRMDNALYESKKAGKNRVTKVVTKDTNTYLNPLEWNTSWECGEKNIDSQHQQILSLAKKIANKKDKSDLKVLLNHIEDHFSYEENLLQEIGYANALEHKKIHGYLLDKAYLLTQKAIDQEISYEEVLEFISHDLIIGHLLKEDTKFFSHFKS